MLGRDVGIHDDLIGRAREVARSQLLPTKRTVSGDLAYLDLGRRRRRPAR